MMLTFVIVLALIAGGFALYANWIYEDRAQIQERLNLVSWSNEKMRKEIDAMVTAAPDIPAPAQDTFLEMASLRTEIAELNEKVRCVTAGAEDSECMYQAERRSNAALRGTITRMTKKGAK